MKLYLFSFFAVCLIISCGNKQDSRPQEVANCQCETFKGIWAKSEKENTSNALILEEMSEIIKCINPYIEELKESTASEIEKFNNTVEQLVNSQCGEIKNKLINVNTVQ